MNIHTKEIAKILGCPLETASMVQKQMGFCGLDFSECTPTEFASMAHECFELIKEGK